MAHAGVHFVASSSRTLPEVFTNRAKATPDGTAYLTKIKGQWQPTTWKGFYNKAAALATFLIDQGLTTGDKICVMGSTRPEWAICDMGGQLAGAVTVGAYPTVPASQLSYILDNSDTRFCFVEGKAEVDKLLEIRKDIPKVEKVVVWNMAGIDPKVISQGWIMSQDDAMKSGANDAKIAKRIQEVKPENTAIIVYTSGTTGQPKGAMISHRNIVEILKGTEAIIPMEPGDISLNFLPMAHVAERIAGFYGRINAGMAGAYATSIPAVLEEVKEVRPTIFGSVPRIFEKAYAKIFSEVAKAPPGKQKAFRWAERVGREVVRHQQKDESIPLGLKIQYALADKLVFSKLREVFGGRVKHFVTGAAPISYEILEFFWAAGFPIYEVYGMTEATVLTHSNPIGKARLGTVGLPISCVEEKLADTGEILVSGPTVFQGYYKNPEATAEAIDSEGWLHTGDVGRKDEKGYLKIVDRIKHIIITSGGKNITPANLEQGIKSQDPLISQVHAHGDRRAYLTAIVTIHPIEAIDWAKSNGLVTDAAQAQAIITELTSNPLARPAGLEEIMRKVTSNEEIRKRMVEAVRRANVEFSRVESIKKIMLLDRDFSAEEDELTPTLKVKRREVEKKYAAQFDRLYTEKDFGFVVEKDTGSAH